MRELVSEEFHCLQVTGWMMAKTADDDEDKKGKRGEVSKLQGPTTEKVIDTTTLHEDKSRLCYIGILCPSGAHVS